MDPSSASPSFVPSSSASHLPLPPDSSFATPLPPLKGFSSCFLLLDALRSTTERIQRSLIAHYSSLADEESEASHSTRASRQAALGASAGSQGEPDAEAGEVVGEKVEWKAVAAASFDDDGGLTVEDDFLHASPPHALTRVGGATEAEGSGKENAEKMRVTSASLLAAAQNAKTPGAAAPREDVSGSSENAGGRTSASSTTASETLKRKREEEIQRIQKKIQRLQANQSGGGGTTGAAAGAAVEGRVPSGVSVEGETSEERPDQSQPNPEKCSPPSNSSSSPSAAVITEEASIDEEIPAPVIPRCIAALNLSEAQRKHFERTAQTLHRELGEADFLKIIAK